MGDKLTIDKSATYHVTFVHLTDADDRFEVELRGKVFHRLRSKMIDMGYEAKEVREAVKA